MNNTLNTTELMTGKDGRLFVEFGGVNVFLAEINTYSVNMNVNTVEKQPVGSILVHSIPTGVTFELSYTEMVVRDDLVMEPLPDGQEQRIAFNNAVPKGTFGLQSLTPGEVIEREHAFALNAIPSFISSLAATYLKST